MDFTTVLKWTGAPTILIAGASAGFYGAPNDPLPLVHIGPDDALAYLDALLKPKHPAMFWTFIGLLFAWGIYAAAVRWFPIKEKRAMQRLAYLRTEGVQIRNAGQQINQANSDQWDQWATQASDWSARVVSTLGIIDKGRGEWFNTLDVVDHARVNSTATGINRDLWHHHDARLIRLENILTQHYSGVTGAKWGLG